VQTPPVPRLVLYGLSVLVAIAVLVAATTSATAFGAYNPAWDGTSELREEVVEDPNGTVALESTAYAETTPPNTTAFVIAPTTAYTPSGTRRIEAFVNAGGTLVVADDYGPHGNELLQAIGATARFDGDQLRDERYYYRAPTLPVATNVSTSPYTDDVDQLTLNGATAVSPGSARVIVATSAIAYLDRNQTGSLTPEDELGRYPVVTAEPVGNGTVIAVSDPSVFINAMASQPDNQAFTTQLQATNTRVVLDYSQAGPQPVLAVALLRVQTTPLAQLLLGFIGVGVTWSVVWSWPATVVTARRTLARIIPATIQTRVPPWLSDLISMADEPRINRAEIRASLAARYPDSERETRDRVMTAVLSSDTQKREHE
jgi:hypothetical protein